ncbi:MAG: 16S rRNA (guanine(966)-N(2))-methyltransferase RsmD [Actinomycetota bacterium]|nr:16S rRNA (guanine(966)-N(2))-methyltransferase RsmD [Actinomycetota bacterium]
MRVVAGEFRGRRIAAPVTKATRPTTDRVREAVFNALSSLDVVVGATVADLYAGSGALGLEALSRGAEHCTFVEKDRAALSAIHDNIATLGVSGRTRVVSGDALVMAKGLTVDVAFADPPYGFDQWPALLANVQAGFVVAESADEVDATEGWKSVRVKRYGRTWVTFLERELSPP